MPSPWHLGVLNWLRGREMKMMLDSFSWRCGSVAVIGTTGYARIRGSRYPTAALHIGWSAAEAARLVTWGGEKCNQWGGRAALASTGAKDLPS